MGRAGMVNVNWKEDASIHPQAGHGLDFCAGEHITPDSLIAVLRGFAWLHEELEEVEILIRPAGETYDRAFLAEARSTIEDFMEHPVVRPSPLSPTLRLWPNA